MKLLLDSHAFLWFLAGDSRLSEEARVAIENRSNERYLSLASIWELAIKHSLGRLRTEPTFAELIATEMPRNRIILQPIVLSHVLKVVDLPFHHRDPFDRLLAAQCLVEGWSMVSGDVILDAYGIIRVW